MRLPDWIKTETKWASQGTPGFKSDPHATLNLLRTQRLITVCEEARCPNRGFCFSKPTATFMILGDTCTRQCSFCSVKKGLPSDPHHEEPVRVAEASKAMGLRYVVITSVTRDDLPDGGASHFAATVRAVKCRMPETKVEILIPDFQGNIEALKAVLQSRPDVLNHNIETVRSLFSKVRPQADYEQSLSVLRNAKTLAPHIKTKSGFMLGFGETKEEVISLLKDLRKVGCNLLTAGQYLRPSKKNVPVVEYKQPAFFEDLKNVALELGFDNVACGPLVRSSMNAEEIYNSKR
ncbi:MAG: lipoyl synthase [Dissulfurispiraceae bacterium]